MAKIILPTYVSTLPSNGAKVEFRPFTVKEEKSLLLALQEDSIYTVAAAIKNVISACTYGKCDPEKMPYYDVEYLYLQIRAKSIGEVLELIGSCECADTAKTEFIVDIESIVIEPKPTGNFRVHIPDTIYTLECRHPSIDDFAKSLDAGEDVANEIVANCIVNIFTDEEVLDWSPKEKLEFVDSMTSKQQKGIATFLKDMPLVKLPTKYKCRECGKMHEGEISGFESFFV
jgi:hypothetical protein